MKKRYILLLLACVLAPAVLLAQIELSSTPFDKFETANKDLSITELQAKYAGENLSVRSINMSQSLIRKCKEAVLETKRVQIEGLLKMAKISYVKVVTAEPEDGNNVIKVYYVPE